MPFSAVFHLYCGGQCTYSCFPRVLLTNISHNILSKPLAAFETMDSGERAINPVALTIFNPWKELWQSRGSNHLPVFKSAALPTKV